MICIFDLDGTLLNTIEDLGRACNYALQTYHFPTHPLSEYPHLVGNGVNKLIERALPIGHKDDTTILQLRQAFTPYYDEHNCNHTIPYDGIPALLQTLRSQHCQLAVASNKYQDATQKLISHFFPQTFDIVLGERANTPRKPDPQIVHDILNSLDTTDPDIFYIGDSVVDIDTARNAQLPVIACTWGFCTEHELTTARPDYIVHHPSEILPIINRKAVTSPTYK